MTSEKAFDMWRKEVGIYDSDAWMYEKAWQAALEWAAEGQELVAWVCQQGGKKWLSWNSEDHVPDLQSMTPLYLHPAPTLEEELAESQAREAKLHQELAGCQAREEYYRSTLEMFLMPMPDKSTTVMDLLLAVTESALEALALPSEDTALKEVIEQAKRQALLEAAEKLNRLIGGDGIWQHEVEDELRRMAEELK